MILQDPLYGRVSFDGEISRLLQTPAVQRLRHIRLSNIDSLDSPSIAGVSRFEHVVGVVSLSRAPIFRRTFTTTEAIAFEAACLLHDVAITPFGHLLEEALMYAGVQFSHESKIASLLSVEWGAETGGVELQIFQGRQSGIAEWAKSAFGSEYEEWLSLIFNGVRGIGLFGPPLSSKVDLDNLDNVARLLHHLGKDVDRSLPERLAVAMLKVDQGAVVWALEAKPLLRKWLEQRHSLYSHLMLSPNDFVAKTMLTAAIVRGLQIGQLGARGYEWTLVDSQLIQLLESAPTHSGNEIEHLWIAETVSRWALGELWHATPLYWVSGPAPSRSAIWAFGEACSTRLGRPCYAHGIPDKRQRKIPVIFEDGSTSILGSHSDRWVLGVSSPMRAHFSKSDVTCVLDEAEDKFGVRPLPVESIVERSVDEASLFDV